MELQTVEHIEVLMPIYRETPVDLLWASVNDEGRVLVSTRGYEKQGRKTVLVCRVEMQDPEAANSLVSDELEWAVLCALTDNSIVYAADRKGGDDDASAVLQFESGTQDAVEIELPMSRVWAMDVSSDGRYLACAGFHAGDGFGPEDEDTWIYDTGSLDSPPVQTPNPHRSNIDVLKWGEADWFLTQSETSRPNHFQFAAQLPGTKKPIWRGKGRGAVVVGKQIVLWSNDGLTLEVWEPGDKEPVKKGSIRIDGEPVDYPPPFTEMPHNMVSINHGAYLVLPALEELWVVEMETFEVRARYRPRPWSHHGPSTCSLFAAPNGEYLAYWCSYHGRGVVIETKHLLG